jgi:branched-chain amino acid transport system ATP-binding protein
VNRESSLAVVGTPVSTASGATVARSGAGAGAGVAGTGVLALTDVEVVYDRVIQVLNGVSLTARAGTITALLGANGAGKSTTLKAISSLLKSERGEMTRGTITFDGEDLSKLAPHEVVSKGVVQVFEGRRVLPSLTVEENLIVGGHTVKQKAVLRQRIDEMYEFFPKLKERRRQLSGFLSGGEQQMLAISRALMSDPRVILFDEPSLGLAPQIVEDIFDKVKHLTEARGLTVLLVEQNAELALEFSSYGYCMENGRIALEGPAAQLLADGSITQFYLGLGEAAARALADGVVLNQASVLEPKN